MRIAKKHLIVTILLGHINKSGQIAGPKTLEHNIDCTLYLRRAYRLRPLFVPKNRFGPAVLEPIALIMDKDGRLKKSPQANAKTAVAFGYAGKFEMAEVQAAVSLGKYGAEPELNAPSLPRPKMKQIIKILSELKSVDLSELSYEVGIYVPGGREYSVELDLPLAVALLGSYLQMPLPPATLFVGELDLLRRIRPPKPPTMNGLTNILETGKAGKIKRVYISEKSADIFAGRLSGSVNVRGVTTLDNLIEELWPSLFKN